MASQTDQFTKTLRIPELNGPCSWVASLAEQITVGTLDKWKNRKEFLAAQLTRWESQISGQLELEDESGEHCDTPPDYVKTHLWFCRKLSVAALAFYLERTKAFERTLEDLKSALEGEPLPGEACEVYEYLVNCTVLEADVRQFQGQTPPKKQKDVEAWSKFEKCFRKRIRKATKNVHLTGPVAHLIKGKLAMIMELHSLKDSHFQSASDISPEWQEVIQEEMKDWEGRLPPECDRRRDAQREKRWAFQRLNLNLPTLDQITEMIKDLKIPEGDFTSEHAAKFSTIDLLLGKILYRSKTNSRERLLTLLKRAELYCVKGLPPTWVKDAKSQLIRCKNKWPTDSMVHHRLGKYHHYIAPDAADPNQAAEFYKEAMNLSPRNYPCLKDYLLFLGRQQRNYPEMVTLIDKHLSYITAPKDIVNLLIVKGVAQWLQDTEESKTNAVATWKEIYQNYPRWQKEAKDYLTADYSREFGPLKLPFRTEVEPQLLNCFVDTRKSNAKFAERNDRGGRAGLTKWERSMRGKIDINEIL